MRTILGPFHPYLEDAFVDEIRACKKADPLSPLLVLVPSTALRQHLTWVLGRQRQLSLLNLHLLTFYQFALALFGETGETPPELRSDLFLEAALRHLIQARAPGTEAFVGIEERAGGCAALWQTLRDLRDGAVEPQLALEALLERPIRDELSERARQILLLFHTHLVFCRDRNICQLSDLDTRAVQRVPASAYLKGFAKIIYYGFYDLTQIQLDFFHAVVRHYPVTLFFPLLPARPAHEGWSFAGRFYERYVQGCNTEPTSELLNGNAALLPATLKLFDATAGRNDQASPQSWRCTIVNSFGVYDEVTSAAKEILRLVEDEGMEFHEIGLVARSLDGYRAAVKDTFHAHRIPLDGALEEPLTQFPLTKAVILLLNLPARDFFRPQVIDLLSSPFFNSGLGKETVRARPELWDLATRELAICKGMAEWRRLRHYSDRDLLVSRSAEDESRLLTVPAAQLRRLSDIVESLAADLMSLPEFASWSEYARRWQELLQRYLYVPSERQPAASPTVSLYEKIFSLLHELEALEGVHHRVSLAEFGQTFQHWLERSNFAPDTGTVNGVRVFDATAARGLSFRALFVLGLNEGVFPRTIREDAFLRDRDREFLERDLGYKVNPKLAAFDEEKLMFTLLVNAAREKLYCSFQRSDESGRVLAPSWYLGELKRVLGGAATSCLTEVTIPRSTREKSTAAPFDRENLLLPEELAVRLSLESQDPSGLVAEPAAAAEIYKHGRTIVAALDHSTAQLSGFDGAVGPLPGYWANFSKRVSPTALESYARCPFQFFVREVLRLEPLEQPETLSSPGAADYGRLGHEILDDVYRSLLERGPFEGIRSGVDVNQAVAAAVRQACAAYEENNPVGYPLLWQCLKENLAELLSRIVARDLADMAQSGFTPVALETTLETLLPDDWPASVRDLTIRGRIDRIDRHTAQPRLRVIDYKFKLTAQPTARELNLERAALRGEKLQPPLYTLLAERWARTRSESAREIEAVFYYIAPRWRGGPLALARFSKDHLTAAFGAELKTTVAALADGIRRGLFYLQRGSHCTHCDIAEICRKNHPPSLWRAENDPITQWHRQIRAKDSPSDEPSPV